MNNHNTLPEEVQFPLQEFPKLTRPLSVQPLESYTKVIHVIDTGDSAPASAKVRQLSAKQEFTTLLQAEVIRPSMSSWSSPIHLVPKSTPRKWRLCGDFSHLNKQTKPDRYPILGFSRKRYFQRLISCRPIARFLGIR